MGVDPGSLAVKGALMAVQMGLAMTQKIKGPRLKSRDVTTADFGTPLERFWGKRRLLGRPIIHAEKLREKKTTSKTKGGKYSDYKYFGTFAVAVADHEVDSISRIWMDKHLVYDLTDAGPISVLGGFFQGLTDRPVKLSRGRNMRIYLGTEVQEPDPRYEEWCEDRYGPDMAPAYRGVCYIFFEDIPLEKFGNRIPQIDVEAINNSSTNYLWDTVTVAGDAFHEGFNFGPDYSKFTFNSGLFDTATRTQMARGGIFDDVTVGSGGKLWRVTHAIGTSGGPYLTAYSLDGQTQSEPIAFPYPVTGPQAFSANRVFLGSIAHAFVQYPTGIEATAVSIPFVPRNYEEDSEGNVWATGVSGTDVYIRCISGSRMGDQGIITTGSGSDVELYINSNDDFIVFQGSPSNTAYRLDNEFNLLDTGSAIGGTKSYQRGSDSLWGCGGSSIVEYSLQTLSTIRTLTTSDWPGSPGGVDDAKYDPINHAIVSASDPNTIVWRFIDRVQGSGINLGDVVSDVADWCGIESVDVADLDQLVYGYSVVQGAGKDMISPLLDIHDVDARPHDFSVQFLTRGNASLGTIPVAKFVREGDDPRYQVTIVQDTDIPRQVTVSFADQDHDQQTNTVVAQRPLDAVDTVRTQQIDLTTYVGTPGDMQKLLDRYFRAQWNRREKVENALTAQYLSIEPGDVYTLGLDGTTWTGKADRVTLTQGRLAIEWTRDETGLHTLGSGTGAPNDARDDDHIYVPSPTKGFVLDIPLVQDDDDLTVPQVYYAAGNYGAGDWPGAALYEGDADLDEYYPWNGVEPSNKAVWGYTRSVLGDASPHLWDRGNTVNIGVNGTLTSCTEADIEDDPTANLAYLGGELLNFTTATLEADGSYTLSGFKRGRRGTEAVEHDSGDEFVLVSSLARDGFGLSDVGTEMSFKAQTVGRDVAEVESIDFDFAGNTLRPYAPARFKWTTDGTDLFGEITRRTRLGGSWTDDGVVPVSEVSEEYEVDIMDGDDVVRTITVTGTNEFTYTAAQISADGFTAAAPPEVNVYQMSDAVGRGFALAA